MTKRDIQGTVKSWSMIKEGKGPVKFYRVLHLVEEPENKYGHRITGSSQALLNAIAENRGPGTPVWFQEEQNGQYWNYVENSLSTLGGDSNVVQDQKQLQISDTPKPPAPRPYDLRQESINFHADLKSAVEIMDRLLDKKFETFEEAGEALSSAVYFIRKVREHHLSDLQ